MKKKPPANLFVSFKTSRAVPCIRPLRRDFMIQATLDAGVRRIDYHPSVALDGRAVRVDALVLQRDDGRFAVDFVDERPLEDPRGEGLLQLGFEWGCTGILAIAAADVRREPRCSAARAVWRFAAVNVSAGDRAQVLDALDREGPVPFRALDGLVATSRGVAEVVYALAAEGSVTLDLAGGLDGRSVVRAGLLWRASTPLLRCGT